MYLDLSDYSEISLTTTRFIFKYQIFSKYLNITICSQPISCVGYVLEPSLISILASGGTAPCLLDYFLFRTCA